LAKKGLRLPILDGDERAADRRFIEHFILAKSRELGKKHGVAYAEAFHYIGPSTSKSAIDEYIKQNAVPLK
jgi:hypothetical protein